MDEEATKAETANAKIEPAATESANGESAAKEKPRAHGRLWAIAALMCVVAIAAGTYLTYSAYKAGDFLKAVAATTTSQALFTSDLLNEYTSTEVVPAAKSIVVDSSGDPCSFTFRIYNCLLDNRNVFNSKDVYARLSIDAEGTTSAWSVKENDAEIATSNYQIGFPGYTATVKTFTVTFSKDDLDKAKFTIKAIVDTGNSPGTNLAMLAATIVPNRRADVTKASVQADWIDANTAKDNVDDYDAYNYRVTVTGKTTKVKLTWGDSVELDPFFVTNHPGAVSGDNSVTFDMEPGSEIINFFRKDGSVAPSSWDAMGVSASAAE